MAEKNQPAFHTKTQKTSPEPPLNLSALLGDIDTILAISVLKYFSSEENPLPIRQISDCVYDFRNPDHDPGIEQENKERDSKNRKISRKLNDIAALIRFREATAEHYGWDGAKGTPCYEDLAGEEEFYCPLADLLCILFGGTVRCTETGVQKFYFQPMISSGHIDLIKSSLMANQYFSEKEAAYLIRAVESLGATKKEKAETRGKGTLLEEEDKLLDLTDCIRDRYAALPNKKKRQMQRSYPLLHTISQLYNAITNGCQIEMRLGAYRRNGRTSQIILADSHPEKPPYRLNPYAIFFTDGHHYLIATKTSDTAKNTEQEKVMHFRVDRILSITPLQAPREKRPDDLQAYWKNRQLGFDQQLYSQMHPTMAYSQKSETKKATLQTKHPIALSIIVDAFGKDNVHVLREVSEADPRTPDSEPKLQSEIEVYAQEDNIVRFCSQQHALVKLLRPDALAEQVAETLRNALADYDA